MSELKNVIETKKTRKERGGPNEYDVDSAKTKDPKTGAVRYWMRTTLYKNKSGLCEIGNWYPIQREAYDLEDDM